MADTNAEALGMMHGGVAELLAQHVSVARGAEQAQRERFTIRNHVHEMQAAAATCDGELDVIFRLCIH